MSRDYIKPAIFSLFLATSKIISFVYVLLFMVGEKFVEFTLSKSGDRVKIAQAFVGHYPQLCQVLFLSFALLYASLFWLSFTHALHASNLNEYVYWYTNYEVIDFRLTPSQNPLIPTYPFVYQIEGTLTNRAGRKCLSPPRTPLVFLRFFPMFSSSLL